MRPLLSRKINDADPRGRTFRMPATNYRGKPARVANDKSKGASVVRHRSSSETTRGAAPMQRVMQREEGGRARSRPG